MNSLKVFNIMTSKVLKMYFYPIYQKKTPEKEDKYHILSNAVNQPEAL